MRTPYYIGLEEARSVLAEIGIELNERQIVNPGAKWVSGPVE